MEKYEIKKSRKTKRRKSVKEIVPNLAAGFFRNYKFLDADCEAINKINNSVEGLSNKDKTSKYSGIYYIKSTNQYICRYYDRNTQKNIHICGNKDFGKCVYTGQQIIQADPSYPPELVQRKNEEKEKAIKKINKSVEGLSNQLKAFKYCKITWAKYTDSSKNHFQSQYFKQEKHFSIANSKNFGKCVYQTREAARLNQLIPRDIAQLLTEKELQNKRHYSKYKSELKKWENAKEAKEKEETKEKEKETKEKEKETKAKEKEETIIQDINENVEGVVIQMEKSIKEINESVEGLSNESKAFKYRYVTFTLGDFMCRYYDSKQKKCITLACSKNFGKCVYNARKAAHLKQLIPCVVAQLLTEEELKRRRNYSKYQSELKEWEKNVKKKNTKRNQNKTTKVAYCDGFENCDEKAIKEINESVEGLSNESKAFKYRQMIWVKSRERFQCYYYDSKKQKNISIAYLKNFGKCVYNARKMAHLNQLIPRGVAQLLTEEELKQKRNYSKYQLELKEREKKKNTEMNQEETTMLIVTNFE